MMAGGRVMPADDFQTGWPVILFWLSRFLALKMIYRACVTDNMLKMAAGARSLVTYGVGCKTTNTPYACSSGLYAQAGL